MASQCKCPSCHEYLGKDTEVDYNAFCGNCGTKFINERGDKHNDKDECCVDCDAPLVEGEYTVVASSYSICNKCNK